MKYSLIAICLLLAACDNQTPTQVTQEIRCLADAAGKVVAVTTQADTKANLVYAGAGVTEIMLNDPVCVAAMATLVPVK